MRRFSRNGAKIPPPPKRTGAHMVEKDGPKIQPKPYWNGRFSFLSTKTGRILHASPMYAPENNKLAIDAIDQVVARRPYLNCFIYDRSCKILNDVRVRNREIWQITTYATDKFRGKGQKTTCNANPYSRPRLTTRLSGLNRSIADQTFSRRRDTREAPTNSELRAAASLFSSTLIDTEIFFDQERRLTRTGTRTRCGRGRFPLRVRR